VAVGDRIPIACTLETGDLPDRLAAWGEMLEQVVERTDVPGGLRLTMSADADVASLAALAAAERGCCAFLDFTITIDARGVALEVTTTDDARPVLDELFGGVRR
jgi:hypothetical protein